MSENASGMGSERRKLILYLSGKWNKKYEVLLEGADLYVCMHGYSSKLPSRFDWYELRYRSKEVSRDIAPKVARVFNAYSKTSDCEEELALINWFYAYSILPVASQLTEISSLIESNNISEVLILSAETSLVDLPAIGVASSETNLGSSNVLGSFIARSIVRAKPDLNIRRLNLKADFLSRRWWRSITLWLSSHLLVLSAIYAYAFSGMRKYNGGTASPRGIISLRNRNHIQFVKQMLSHDDNLEVSLLPQYFRFSRNISLVKSAMTPEVKIYRPKNRAIVKAYIYAATKLFTLGSTGPDSQLAIRCGGFSFCVNMDVLRADYRKMFIFEFHRRLIGAFHQEYPNLENSIGFEVEGPFAYLEGLENRRRGVQTKTLQTVLVQDNPKVCFPLVDEFFADSSATAEKLDNLGEIRFGRVVYRGSPYKRNEGPQRNKLHRITYFTQPYEWDVSIDIIEIICEFASLHDINVYLRLHPRDNASHYTKLVKRFSNVLYISNEMCLDVDVDKSDLCVTRTSSVAKQIVSRKKRMLLSLFSEFDISVRADYIVSDSLRSCYVANNKGQLLELLNNYAVLDSAVAELQARLFGSCEINVFSEIVR